MKNKNGVFYGDLNITSADQDDQQAEQPVQAPAEEDGNKAT